MNGNQELYRKVVKGKATRYEAMSQQDIMLHLGLPVDDGIVTTVEFNDEECLTVAASLGFTLLLLLEGSRPKMKNGTPSLIERKIRNVNRAIKDLFVGTGCRLNIDISEGVMRTWDETMQRIANEGIDDRFVTRLEA